MVRYVPDRLLHQLRRRRAEGQLRRRRFPTSILVVCHGNICRSPYAAGVVRRLLPTSTLRVVSAGFTGPDRPAPPDAIASAVRRGVDLSRHRSKVLVPSEVRAADLIVVMDSAQRRAICEGYHRAGRDVLVLGDLDPAPIATRAIRDPLEQPPAVFDASYARIDRCVSELVRLLRLAAPEK